MRHLSAEGAWRDLEHNVFGQERLYEFLRRGWEIVPYQFVRQIAAWQRRHSVPAHANQIFCVDLGDDVLIYTDEMRDILRRIRCAMSA